jgi:fucose permease
VLMCQGAATASWVTRLPSIKATLHLGSGGLGLALVGTPIGFALAVAVAPAGVRKFSSAVTARWGITCATLAIVLPALAWDGATLALGLVLLGLAFGVSDIATNVQAIAVERAYGRPVMTGMHAMWSVGLVVGSAGAALAAALSVDPLTQLLLVGASLAAVAGVAGRWFLNPQLEDADLAPTSQPPRRRRLLAEPVLVITGLIAFCAFLSEGSVSDWGSVYMHFTQHASLSVAALTVTVYSVGQTVSRLAGNRVVTRIGRTATIWRAALVAAVGMTLAILAPSAPAALAGYCILGIGGAMIVPTAFSIAGIASGVAPAWGLSRVTAMGYAGSFLGPACIGLVAHGVGLKAALAIPAVLLVLVVPLTVRLTRELGAQT